MISFIKKFDHRYLFPYLKPGESESYFIKKDFRKYPLDEQSLKHTPKALKQYFINCTLNWGLEEFHFCYTRDCIIEPSAGWGITKNHKVIPQSIWNYYIHRVNKPYYLRFLLAPAKKIYLPVAISLQYAWMNYWHFYNDVLGQLNLADEAGLPYDTPVVIPAGVQQMNYFKAFLSLSCSLRNRNWIFQDRQTKIYCKETHFFNTYWDHRKNFDGALRYIDFEHKLKHATVESKRIFITRKKNKGRNIINIDEVQKTLAQYSFEILDCEDLSIEEQIDLFQSAGYVVGIHGAGLTNIIYRCGKTLKVLEIFSANYFNPSYYWLCQQYHYDYYAIVGSEADDLKTTTGNFGVNIQELERQLAAMIGNG